MYQPLQNARLYEQVVHQIEERIVNSDIEPGDKLPSEIELADQFGVSRTVIREATKTLRAKGLIEVRLGHGTFITGGASQILHTSIGQVLKTCEGNRLKDLNELWTILEPKITLIAVERADEKDIDTLQNALKTMQVSIHDAESFVDADLDFRHALVIASKNPLMIQLMAPVLNLLRGQLIKIFIEKEGENLEQNYEMRIAHHKRILESVIRRDPHAAIDAMQNQLRVVRLYQD